MTEATTGVENPASASLIEGPDAGLIAMCSAHLGRIIAYNATPGMSLDEAEKHPAWLAYSASRDFINGAKPKTREGLRALAFAAKAEIACMEDGDSVAGTPAEFWSVEIINALVDGVADQPPPNYDARLIAVCAEFVDVELRQRAIYDTPDRVLDDDAAKAAAKPLELRLGELLDEMGRLHAVSAAGVQARAHALAVHNADLAFSFDYEETMAGRLLGYLMRDTAAVAIVTAAAARKTPDAAILANAKAFMALQVRVADLWRAVPDGAKEEDPRVEAVYQLEREQTPYVDALCNAVAVTGEGHQARARALAAARSDFLRSPDGHQERLIAALVRDLIGEGAQA